VAPDLDRELGSIVGFDTGFPVGELVLSCCFFSWVTGAAFGVEFDFGVALGVGVGVAFAPTVGWGEGCVLGITVELVNKLLLSFDCTDLTSPPNISHNNTNTTIKA